MKLTKSKLIKSIQDTLTKLGYVNLKDSLTGSNGLFVKRVGDDLYLSLGLIMSDFYDSRFTASYYLSKTIRWSSVWDDIPRESYQRVGHFLTGEERTICLSKDQHGEEETDAWWNGNEEKEIDKFLEVITITQNRFLEQDGLFFAIENSLEVNALADCAVGVLSIIALGEIAESHYKFVPQKPIDNIPIEWFKAAETVLADKGGILNANTVKLLGADAWRQNLLTRN